MAPITVSEISRLDLRELETPTLGSITDVKPLSSYNWIEAPNATPTIAVPGSPALWSASGVSRRVKKDSGLIYIAQNAARHPESPLEPLFRAFSTRNGLEAFTINIKITKNTAIFCRDEAKTIEYIGPQEFRGFGHEFKIISYCFSDMNFIVRHETDGYVDTDIRTSSSKAKNHTLEDIASLVGALSISPANNSPGIIPTGSKLMIKEEGQVVPLESTLEIKTRVFHKSLEIHEVAPQLWVSQTPKLVRASHQNGTFQRPVVEDVTAQIKSWKERKQNDLRKLAALIRRIVNLVKECGGNAVLKYNVEGDKLVVCKVERKEMLPKDLYSKWDDVQNLEADTDTQNDSTQGPKIAQTRQASMSAIETTGDDLKTTIRIGDVDYSINVFKIPYFASFVRLQKVTQPEATEFIHELINLFDVALKGVEMGYRQCFRSLPTDLSQYRMLFETYKFLNVDVLSGMSINEVIANLKVGKSDYNPEERRPIPGNKSLARDTAFQLLYLILHTEFGDELKDSMKLFNAVMFVVSHPGTFKYRTKRVTRVVYEERFRLTTKQKARLDQWEKGETVNNATDVTTEEEPDYFSDSDYSF
ncbi:MAG: hypothetical protein M1812_008293 [Candelaria pacifica]|nr:MAG: hypothetical protein M1812_008293 [Candelaria pacifica]